MQTSPSAAQLSSPVHQCNLPYPGILHPFHWNGSVHVLGLIGLLTLLGCATTTIQPQKASRELKAPLSYSQVPLSFEANQGQTDRQVQFLARGQGYNIFLTAKEAVFAFNTPAARLDDSRKSRERTSEKERVAENANTKRAVIRMQFLGANPDAQVNALDELPGKVNYFRGNDPTQWRANVPTYRQVKYTAVYPGVDLVYYGHSHQLEYDFIVAPGADPSAIALGFQGAKAVDIDAQGDLVLSTAVGDVRFHRPLVYQEVHGERETIDGGYVSKGSDAIGFQVGSYDRSRPLIIDPTLSYSTYLGGSGFDVGIGIAVDAAGAAHVTGGTVSPDFPIVNSLQPTVSGVEAFVAKFTPDGRALVYSTFLGGSLEDEGTDIAVDADGAVYITGNTNSPDFPTINAVQPASGGGIRPGPPGPQPASDAFVAKLTPDGSALVYSTYLGGSGMDFGFGIAVDASGAVYVTGDTASLDFPTIHALQPALGGFRNIFVAKLTSAGTTLVYSTYLGGNNLDSGPRIAVNATGEGYIVGTTNSTDFPLVNALQPTFNGQQDAFVTKFTADGATLIYSTYLGGSGNDNGKGIAVDVAGLAYVTGYTDSPDFPMVRALQPTYGGFGLSDGFVVKLGADGTTFAYSTYLGGSNNDFALAIAVDNTGAAYVTGGTDSPDFPIVDALQPTLGGDADAFVAKLAPDGDNIVYSTYLGGSIDDEADAIAVNSAGAAYITGGTHSTDFPTINAIQPGLGGTPVGHDAFVAKISPPTFAGTPGKANCRGQSISALARQYGGLNAAASALGFSSVRALQDAVRRFCEG
jgi:hypothetical protein